VPARPVRGIRAHISTAHASGCYNKPDDRPSHRDRARRLPHRAAARPRGDGRGVPRHPVVPGAPRGREGARSGARPGRRLPRALHPGVERRSLDGTPQHRADLRRRGARRGVVPGDAVRRRGRPRVAHREGRAPQSEPDRPHRDTGRRGARCCAPAGARPPRREARQHPDRRGARSRRPDVPLGFRVDPAERARHRADEDRAVHGLDPRRSDHPGGDPLCDATGHEKVRTAASKRS